MRRFGWKNTAPEEEARQTSPGSDDQRVVDTSPARSFSYRSTNSSRSGLSKSGRGKDESPSKLGAAAGAGAPDAAGSGGGGGDGGGVVSNKKMLKIGANVRFRGDVMECNTVILCGRLQGFVETRRLTVKEGGIFVGDAKVEDADVYGSFDGSLESTSKVSIRSTGNIMGSVVYRRMSMEDGGELEGTCECSNRASGRGRKAGAVLSSGREGANTSAVADAAEANIGVSSSSAGERGTPPREQSPPPWKGVSGFWGPGGKGDGAGASATLSDSATPPPRVSHAQPIASAVAVTAAAAAGGGGAPPSNAERVSSRPLTVTPSASSPAEPVNIVRQALPAAAGVAIRGGIRPAKGTIGGDAGGGGGGSGSAGSGSGSVSGSSPTVSRGGAGSLRAPSPVRSAGLQVQTQSAEAGEMFSAEELSPTGLSSIFASHAASDTSGRRTPPSRDRAAEAAALLEGGTSVAARVGTWPPASPASTRSWSRNAETSLTPRFASKVALAASPVSTPKRVTPVSLTPSAVPKTPALPAVFAASASTLPVAPIASTRPSHQPTPSSEDVSVLSHAQGGTGTVCDGSASTVVAVGRVGGGGDGRNGNAAETGDEADSEVDDKGEAGEGAGEISGPTKACEGSGCTLEACWGDPRFRPRYCARHKKQGSKLMDPVEQEEGDKVAAPEGLSPPAARSPSPEVLSGTRDATAAAMALGGGDAASESPPAPFIAMAPVALPVPVEPVGGRGSVMSEAPRVPRPGNQSSTAAYGGARNTPIVTRVKSGAGGPGTETEEEGLEDDEDEDEGWDNGDGGGGAVVELNGTGGSGIFPAALQAIQAEVVQSRRESLEGSDVDGDVRARVGKFARLANKSQTVPKPKVPSKPKKRESGNNIADFYRGGESESDEDEQSFNMDAYSKGVLLSQATEVGTHTEDGQLRPQPSQERDQQRLAHLMRVGKLGSALRGKGVSAVGKRR